MDHDFALGISIGGYGENGGIAGAGGLGGTAGSAGAGGQGGDGGGRFISGAETGPRHPMRPLIASPARRIRVPSV